MGAIGLSAAWVEMLSYAVHKKRLHWQDQKDIIAGKWTSVCEVEEELPETALFVIKRCQKRFCFHQDLA